MDIGSTFTGEKAVLTVSGEELGTIELGLDALLEKTDPLVRFAPELETLRGFARDMKKQINDAMREAEANGRGE